MSDATRGTHASLVSELWRRLDAGELSRGDTVTIDDESFEVEGFDPFGADGRCVHIKTSDGKRRAIRIPQA